MYAESASRIRRCLMHADNTQVPLSYFLQQTGKPDTPRSPPPPLPPPPLRMFFRCDISISKPYTQGDRDPQDDRLWRGKEALPVCAGQSQRSRLAQGSHVLHVGLGRGTILYYTSQYQGEMFLVFIQATCHGTQNVFDWKVPRFLAPR